MQFVKDQKGVRIEKEIHKTQNHFVLRDGEKKKRSQNTSAQCLVTISIVPVTPRRRQNFAFVFRVKKKKNSKKVITALPDAAFAWGLFVPDCNSRAVKREGKIKIMNFEAVVMSSSSTSLLKCVAKIDWLMMMSGKKVAKKSVIYIHVIVCSISLSCNIAVTRISRTQI